LYPASHGVRDFTDRLPSSAVTMAEIFQEAGYATINFSSNLFTATFSNFHQGFEQVHEDTSLSNPDSSKTAREYMDRLLPWIDTHRDVPFFVFFHAYDAHDPYEPYPPYNTMWADPKKKEEHERQLAEARKIIRDPLMKVFGMPTREEMVQAKVDPEAFVSHVRDWYDGSIRGLDAEIGRLLEHLRNRNLADRTLVVFTGDHGEEFLEHGRMFHGQTVYGELTNIPLIFWGAGVSRGLTVENTEETVDIMPTVLELAGLKTTAHLQGRSFASLLRNAQRSGTAEAATQKSEPAFSEKAITKDAASPAPHDTESFAVVQDGWKLIHNTKRSPETLEYELYDQKKDPLNRINLAEQNPEVVKRLARTLDQWRRSSAAARLKPDSEAAKGLSQEELERLRSLGYIQ
ncbi:MAG TPA: sulfatase, partial [Acidobacteriota bacterium]